MELKGQDVLDIGATRIGQKYVLGAMVPLDNPSWKGPWDCAEFTSWCAYQAYGMIFGAGGAKRPAKAEPYSGHWFADAKKHGRVIKWKDALNIPGAALIRAPAASKIGHVAFAMGDNDRTLEARGAAYGVGIFGKAHTRSWSIGCLLPGVDYDGKEPASGGLEFKPEPLPDGFLWLRIPNFKGTHIVALQKALLAKGINPGPVDGELGPMSNAAIVSFQIMNGLEVDGVVGPYTAAALGLSFPLPKTDENAAIFNKAQSPSGPAKMTPPPAPAGFDAVTGFKKSGKTYTATTQSGHTFIVGTTTTFTDDMTRVGLFQGKMAIKNSLQFGMFNPLDFAGTFGQWAHFIAPTLSAEAGARFATINTYDRAAFTFGAPQLAAHTPDANFIVYLRKLLAVPSAAAHFPELSLRQNTAGKTTVHLSNAGGIVDLETVVLVTRPNNKTENQLALLMEYLNSSPTAVDEAELLAAARLMNLLRIEPKAKELQIEVFIEHAAKNLKRAKAKVPGFDGSDWRTALWIMDIMHQGRGTFSEMSIALASATPVAALMRIGLHKYKSRIETVEMAANKLETSGVLNGFKV